MARWTETEKQKYRDQAREALHSLSEALNEMRYHRDLEGLEDVLNELEVMTEMTQEHCEFVKKDPEGDLYFPDSEELAKIAEALRRVRECESNDDYDYHSELLQYLGLSPEQNREKKAVEP